jgi:hypothetical protein
MNAFFLPAESSPPTLDPAVRESLAILLLSTDILRQYGVQLEREELREQWQGMHQAAVKLSGLMRPGDIPATPAL